jgi:GTP-binding protein Era
MLFDAARNSAQEDQEITKAAEQYGRKRLAVVNKIDLLNSEQLQPRLQQLAELTKISPQQILRISALNGLGIFGLLRSIRKLLPEGPLYYPADTLTDQSERFIAAELIREQIFLSTAQEVPYGCAVRIESYKEAKDGIRIQAEIIVERDSLKGMIVGQRGSKIKDIGIQARAAISHLTGLPVHLNLFVKVLKNWRKNEKAIKDFGY